MEIIEAVVGVIGALLESSEGCLCFMQILALMLDGSSFFTGYRAVSEGKKRQAQREAGATPQGRNSYKLIFWLLLPFALFTTAMVVFSLVVGRLR